MTNEIKEILDYFRKYSTIRENTMITDIENYITNLQEDIANYVNIVLHNRKVIDNLQNEIFDLKDTIQNKNDCIGAYECIIEDRDKRIDKAINYILENICCDTRVYTKNENVYKVVDILRGDE